MNRSKWKVVETLEGDVFLGRKLGEPVYHPGLWEVAAILVELRNGKEVWVRPAIKYSTVSGTRTTRDVPRGEAIAITLRAAILGAVR